MRISRLYSAVKLHCGDSIKLDENASRHLIRVLRTKPDSELILFNGDGFNYLCKTLDNNAKNTHISIISKKLAATESNLNITLIQGLSRQDRLETTLQKSVELGVTRIIPVNCQRSNHRLSKDKLIKKRQHWKKVIISACEQSGRCRLPEITQIMALTEITSLLNKQAIKLNLNPSSDVSLTSVTHTQQAVEIFIGPEGGLDVNEVTVLKQHGFEDICFGPRILRTETAGPAVISALQILWGDF